MAFRIALGQFWTESNSFSPLLASREMFEYDLWAEGDRLLEQTRGALTVMGGFLNVLEQGGVEVVPTLGAYCPPSGPIEQSVWEEIRNTLVDRRTGMGVIALLVAYILAPVLSESIGYVGMGAVIAILTTIGYLIVILGSQEDPERMKEPAEGLINALRLTLKSVPYRRYMGGHICRDFIFLVTSATLPFWSKYVLKMTTPKPVFGMILEPANQEALLLAVPFLLSVPCLLIWNYLTPRIGARRTWMVGILTYLPACLVIILADGFYTGLLGTALLAPGIAALSMMPLIQLAEVIDDDARRTGKRREGAFMGMSSGIAKLSFTIQGLLFATILPLSGYVPNVADQALSAIWGIRFLMGGATVIAVLITVFCLHRLRLPGLRVEEAASAAALPGVRRQRAALGDYVTRKEEEP